MSKLKKLGQIQWTHDTTLSSLWRAWMDLNGLTTENQAAAAISSLGIRGGENIAKWLQNEPTRSLLSTNMKALVEKTGVDIDGWLVAESKRLVIAEHPELASKLPFDKMTSREEVVSELEAWAKLYGGTHYLAVQMRIPSGQTNHYMQRSHQPSLETLPSILRMLAQGFILIDCQEDVVFILTCRAIMGDDPEIFFPGVTNFKTAIAALLAPFKGYQDKKVESETGIHYALIHELRNWKPVSGKRGMVPETIEKILRVLVVRKYPALGDAFDTNRALYRKDEAKGIMEVPIPLKVLINAQKEPPRVTKKEPPPQPESAPVEMVVIPEPVKVIAERVMEALPDKGASDDLSLRNDLADLFGEMSTRLRTPSKPAPVQTDARNVGVTIESIQHCLDQSSWKRRKGVRLSKSEIESLRLAIEKLRAIFVGMNELDPEYIRSDLAPVFGPELIELFLAGEGLKHLLETQGAWRVIAASRETAHIMRNNKGE